MPNLESRIQEIGSKGAHLEWLTKYANKLNFIIPSFSVIPIKVFDDVISELPERFSHAKKLKDAFMTDNLDAIKEEFPEFLNENLIDHYGVAIKQLPKNKQKIIENMLKGGVFYLVLKNISKSEQLMSKIKNLVQPYFANYIGKPHAVRSSATCEDNIDFSFAGFFLSRLPDEFINLKNEKEVKRAFTLENAINSYTEVISQFFSVRELIEYGNLSSNDKIGVIVQDFIYTKPSGTLYTSLPEEPDIFALSLVNATCERAVRGEEDEGICINRKTNEIEKYTINPTISEQQLKQLFDTGISLEKEYGRPLDIEFGYFNNQLYIFQARPIPVYSEKKIFEIPQDAKEIIQMPLNLNHGVCKGRLVKYDPLVKHMRDLDDIDFPYILITDEAGNNWWNILDLEYCEGAIIIVNAPLSRCAHDANLIRQSNKIITQTNIETPELEQYLTKNGKISISSEEFILATKGRKAVLYKI